MHLEIVLQTQGPFEELTWITVVNKKNENEELLKGSSVRNDHIGYRLAVFSYTLFTVCTKILLFRLHIQQALYKHC